MLWSVITDAEVLLIVGILTLLFVARRVVPWRRKLLAAGAAGPRGPGACSGAALAGLTSFISHTGGPPAQVYLLPQRLPPNIYSGTTVVFFAAINMAKLVPYYFLGQLSVANLEIAAWLAPVAIAFMLLGVFLVRRVSAKLFYQLAYVLVFFVALKLIYDGWIGVFAHAGARHDLSPRPHRPARPRSRGGMRFLTEPLGLTRNRPTRWAARDIRWIEIGDGRRFHVQAGDISGVHVEKQTHFALTAADFDATLARFRARRHRLLRHEGHARRHQHPPDGMRAIFLQDPNGYWFEINSGNPS